MQAFAKTLWKTRKFSIQEFGFPTYIIFLHHVGNQLYIKQLLCVLRVPCTKILSVLEIA